jgi:hypothetical protein
MSGLPECFDFGSLVEEAQAAVEEDDQICVRRS